MEGAVLRISEPKITGALSSMTQTVAKTPYSLV
jgi:hypothetical protein